MIVDASALLAVLLTRLSFGDGFAKAESQPLLFKGDDFTHTDMEPTLKA